MLLQFYYDCFFTWHVFIQGCIHWFINQLFYSHLREYWFLLVSDKCHVTHRKCNRYRSRYPAMLLLFVDYKAAILLNHPFELFKKRQHSRSSIADHWCDANVDHDHSIEHSIVWLCSCPILTLILLNRKIWNVSIHHYAFIKLFILTVCMQYHYIAQIFC